MQLAFFVPGTPTPKGRPRFTRTGITYTPAKTVAASALVADWWLASGAVRLQGPLRLSCVFIFERPKSHLLSDGVSLSAAGLRATQPPADVDNLVKLVMDALNGLAWDDDRQVVVLDSEKRWSRPFKRAGTEIRATQLTDAEQASRVR